MSAGQVFRTYRTRLSEIADELRKECGLHLPPVNPYLLARHMKVDVVEAHLNGLDGFVEPINDGRSEFQWRAFLSRGCGRERKRFTLTHELGHVVLMRDARRGLCSGLVRYRSADRTRVDLQDPLEERLCDAFAADVLVPDVELRRRVHLRSFGPDSLIELARVFDVSLHVAARKVGDLAGRKGYSCSLWNTATPWPVCRWVTGQRFSGRSEAERAEAAVQRAIGSGVPIGESWASLGLARSRFEVRVYLMPERAILLAIDERVRQYPCADADRALLTQLTLW